MTLDEVLDLLTHIALRDNRQVSKGTALVWHEDVGDLDFEDCREAVRRHFRESTDWLMPAHIRRQVKAIHEARVQASGLAVYQALKARDPETEQEYRDALKQIMTGLGNRADAMPFRAIEAGRSDVSDGPSPVFTETKDRMAEERAASTLAAARAEVDWAKHATCETCRTLLDPDGSCFTCTSTPTPSEESE